MNGVMVEDMKASGLRTKCMVKDNSHFLMEDITKEVIETTRRMEEEFTFGLMEGDMKVSSTKENSMELELLSQKMGTNV